MKLTKNHLKQLIQEMMEAEEMEAESEEAEGLDFDNLPSSIYKFPSNYWIVGPERDKAKEEDPDMKELEGHVMDGGEGLILGKSDGRINVLIVFRDVNPFTGLDRGVGWGREGHSGGGTRGGLDLSPEDALDYLKRGAELIQDPAAKSAFMSVTEEDLENMPDDTYFVAKTDKKGPKEERPKSRPSRSSRGYERDDEERYVDRKRRYDAKMAKRYGRAPRGFEEGKLTKSKLLQIIREEIEAEIEEKSSGPLHEAYYAMRDFVDNLRDEALQEEGIDLADDLFDAIHDVAPFPDEGTGLTIQEQRPGLNLDFKKLFPRKANITPMTRKEVEAERNRAASRGVRDPFDLKNVRMVGGSPAAGPVSAAGLGLKYGAKVLAKEISIDQAQKSLFDFFVTEEVPAPMAMANKTLRDAMAKLKK